MAVPVAERRAALTLLAGLFGYGLIMQAISGVSTHALLGLALVYEPMAAFSILLIGGVSALIWLVSPASRRNVETRLFWLIVAGAMAWLLFPFFAMFKQIVLPTRGFPWDRTFAHVGRWLFGVSPWTLVHGVFGTMAGARLLDFLYSIWLPLIFVFPQVVAVAFAHSILRFRLILTWFASWVMIGSLAAWAFASAGPIYFNSLIGPDRSYADLQINLAHLARLAQAEGKPIAALEFQPILLNAFRLHDLGPAGGISAMPSMHVALATLLAIAAFHRNRAWGLLFSAYAVLIWAGSIFFGWHYFVDGPVAVAMVYGLWWASDPIASSIYRGGVAEGSAAALPAAAASRPAMTSVQGELSPLPSPPHFRNFLEST
ncbi:MAG: phosphatase PAP2 family protein [Sphingomicrobium sp.]